MTKLGRSYVIPLDNVKFEDDLSKTEYPAVLIIGPIHESNGLYAADRYGYIKMNKGTRPLEGFTVKGKWGIIEGLQHGNGVETESRFFEEEDKGLISGDFSLPVYKNKEFGEEYFLLPLNPKSDKGECIILNLEEFSEVIKTMYVADGVAFL
ncbi:MAG: hypothetical protein GTN38_04415 [Candidatus Aenigmarchaeota archaeon]|nr:hypothetical protein [Candidatus Aenigmarchaeota archaeon]NIQ18585.1 hypothetical protein [Candidatus Aenigmarchaeota archaeon]NIS73600.1 hypothetical protein [Candidatus Aenigmarchaeota archaeon]